VAGAKEWKRILQLFLKDKPGELGIEMAQVMRTREEVARILEDFLSSSGRPWNWDDFLSFSLDDEELEAIRVRCAALDSEYPANEKGHFCGPQGFEIIRSYIQPASRRGAWVKSGSWAATLHRAKIRRKIVFAFCSPWW
jgi:hypothetical protein